MTEFLKYLGTVFYGSDPFSVSLALSETKTDNYWSRDTIIRRDYDNTSENMDLTLSLDDPAQLAPGGRAPQFYRSKSVQGSKDYEAELKWSVPVSHVTQDQFSLQAITRMRTI